MSDILIISKKQRERKIVDLAVPGDHNINAKELKKVIKYEIATAGAMEANVILVVIGTTGTISNNLEKHLRTNGIPIAISCLQKAALLCTVFIFRRVLGISEGG